MGKYDLALRSERRVAKEIERFVGALAPYLSGEVGLPGILPCENEWLTVYLAGGEGVVAAATLAGWKPVEGGPCWGRWRARVSELNRLRMPCGPIDGAEIRVLSVRPARVAPTSPEAVIPPLVRLVHVGRTLPARGEICCSVVEKATTEQTAGYFGGAGALALELRLKRGKSPVALFTDDCWSFRERNGTRSAGRSYVPRVSTVLELLSRTGEAKSQDKDGGYHHYNEVWVEAKTVHRVRDVVLTRKPVAGGWLTMVKWAGPWRLAHSEGDKK